MLTFDLRKRRIVGEGAIDERGVESGTLKPFADDSGIEGAAFLVHESADRDVCATDVMVAALAADEGEHAQAEQVAIARGVVEFAVVLVRVEEAEQAPLHADQADPLDFADPLRALPRPRAERVCVEPDGFHGRGCTQPGRGQAPAY